jgi:hypothetical protein
VRRRLVARAVSTGRVWVRIQETHHRTCLPSQLTHAAGRACALFRTRSTPGRTGAFVELVRDAIVVGVGQQRVGPARPDGLELGRQRNPGEQRYAGEVSHNSSAITAVRGP